MRLVTDDVLLRALEDKSGRAKRRRAEVVAVRFAGGDAAVGTVLRRRFGQWTVSVAMDCVQGEELVWMGEAFTYRGAVKTAELRCWAMTTAYGHA